MNITQVVVSCGMLLIVGGGHAQVRGQYRVKYAEFHVVSKTGVSQEFIIRRLADEKGKSVVDHCAGLVCTDLVGGKYEYVLESQRNKDLKVTGVAMLEYPTVLTTVTLHPEGEGGSVSGNVSNLMRPQECWVRAQSIFGNYHVDGRVNANGKFELHGIVSGVYLVAVLDKQGEVLAYRKYECCSALGNQEVVRQNGVPRPAVEFGRFRRTQ